MNTTALKAAPSMTLPMLLGGRYGLNFRFNDSVLSAEQIPHSYNSYNLMLYITTVKMPAPINTSSRTAVNTTVL
jgi:hypothetical protein